MNKKRVLFLLIVLILIYYFISKLSTGVAPTVSSDLPFIKELPTYQPDRKEVERLLALGELIGDYKDNYVARSLYEGKYGTVRIQICADGYCDWFSFLANKIEGEYGNYALEDHYKIKGTVSWESLEIPYIEVTNLEKLESGKLLGREECISAIKREIGPSLSSMVKTMNRSERITTIKQTRVDEKQVEADFTKFDRVYYDYRGRVLNYDGKGVSLADDGLANYSYCDVICLYDTQSEIVEDVNYYCKKDTHAF